MGPKVDSFHLNQHTIHFFYNEHLRDFPLYTEAIKFFKHSESMVRIAVRTLTLNVYKGQWVWYVGVVGGGFAVWMLTLNGYKGQWVWLGWICSVDAFLKWVQRSVDVALWVYDEYCQDLQYGCSP